jgi:hypothetical protein
MPERPNASTQPQCPSGSRTGTAAMPERPKTPRRPCNHHTAMPERSMASGPRHQDTQATITPQCPSGPWTSAAAMPERLRDNHAPATPQCHGQAQPQCPSGLGTLTQPAHRNARAVHASNPQCPIGRGATTGGSTKDKRAEHVRPQVSRVVSSPAAARARPSNLVRDGR